MGESTLADRLNRIRSGFSETPIVPLDHARLDLFAKLEFSNASGSVKDRSAYVILQRAVERGEITGSSTVVESSSGNFAIALASLCRLLRVPFVPVIDPHVNASTELFLRTSCARVEKVTEPDAHGGYLRTRLARVDQLTASLENAFWPDQYANPDAADAHDMLTGAEICRTFDRLDYLFIGVGTGATIAGISRRVKRLMPRTKVIAVDSAGSAIFGEPARPRYIPGIGSSIRPPLLDLASIDDVVIVEESDTVAACHRLVRRFGFFVGGSTGSVYAAIEKYFADYRGPRPSVMFLCADRGTAYADTVYRPGWLDSIAEPAAAR
ncbi:2,3-diaminopropionate biosynthesis protein SbnA [Streptomyces sp. CB01881]|uniref:2,3-diaminopropionate biosynthesis protein SbnA n=1 Tax=Streptomyces sp. CB01881 TaxID=2078691 RepID=UPI000CDC9630|nr:2,3-diaminopropionate biosynthesis protein SbnA [Streptomyces sp. CB01881]AUY52516.1 2,3-diaminopropionate biosynthesis protein SbnA [Streptomyces sp. CB01881]TYC70233.1 2,3-diaminopropionate biosynthesis protein SbnA [Streptomyces sp. CB01881]